jgi:hypothetical protein
LIKFLGPAFYGPSWAPWLRIMITGLLVFGAALAWRLYGR